MDPSLKTVLFVFLFYSLLCVLPLWSTFKSTKRSELMINGAYLIFFASFVLTGLALVTGVAETLAGTKTLDGDKSKQLKDFMQFIIFGGFVITLLFGSVGANIFSSGLLNDSNLAVLKKLDELETKIDKLHESALKQQSTSKSYSAIKLLAVIGALGILYWAW